MMSQNTLSDALSGTISCSQLPIVLILKLMMASFVPYKHLSYAADGIYIADVDMASGKTRVSGKKSHEGVRTPLQPRSTNPQQRNVTGASKDHPYKQSAIPTPCSHHSKRRERTTTNPTSESRPSKRTKYASLSPSLSNPRLYRFNFGKHEGKRPCEVPDYVHQMKNRPEMRIHPGFGEAMDYWGPKLAARHHRDQSPCCEMHYPPPVHYEEEQEHEDEEVGNYEVEEREPPISCIPERYWPDMSKVDKKSKCARYTLDFGQFYGKSLHYMYKDPPEFPYR
jgi:hypothetical protein